MNKREECLRTAKRRATPLAIILAHIARADLQFG